jgi:hypothetical protein
MSNKPNKNGVTYAKVLCHQVKLGCLFDLPRTQGRDNSQISKHINYSWHEKEVPPALTFGRKITS